MCAIEKINDANRLVTEEGWWSIRGHTSKLGFITDRQHELLQRQETDLIKPRDLGSRSRLITI